MDFVPKKQEELWGVMVEATPNELLPALQEFWNAYLPDTKKGEIVKSTNLNNFLSGMGSYNLFNVLINMELLEVDSKMSEQSKMVPYKSVNQRNLKNPIVARNKITKDFTASGGTIIPEIIKISRNLRTLTGEDIKSKINSLEEIIRESESATLRRNKLEKADKETSYDFAKSIEEIFEDKSKLEKVQSYREREQIQNLLGLNEAILESYKKFDAFLAQGMEFHLDEEFSDVNIAPSGGVLSYIQGLQDQGKLTDELLIEYKDSLKNKGLDPDVRKYRYTVLTMYMLRNRTFGRAAVQHFFKDFDEIKKLPQNHPVLKNIKLPNISSIKDLINKQEFTFFDIERVMDSNIIEFRSKLNEWYYNSEQFNRNEYEEAIKYFTQKIYDPDNSSLISTKLDYALSQKDKSDIKNMLLSENDLFMKQRNRFESRNHSLFKERINGVLSAYRKTRVLEETLSETNMDEETLKKEFEVFRKKSFNITNTESITDLDAQDFKERLEEYISHSFVSGVKSLTAEQESFLKKTINVKIIDADLINQLKQNNYSKNQTEFDFLVSLKSKKESRELTQEIEYINNSKLLLEGEITLFKKKYYSPQTYKSLSRYKELGDILKSEEKRINDEEIKTLNKKLDEYKNNFLVVEISDKKISIKNTDVNKAISERTTRWENTNIRYITKQNLDAVIRDLEESEKLTKSKYISLIAEFGGQVILNELGYKFTDKGFFFTIQEAIKDQYNITYTTKKNIEMLASEITDFINQNLYLDYVKGDKAISRKPTEEKYWVNLGKDTKKAEIFAKIMNYSEDKIRYNVKFGYSLNKPQSKAEISIIASRLKKYYEQNDEKITINIKQAK